MAGVDARSARTTSRHHFYGRRRGSAVLLGGSPAGLACDIRRQSDASHGALAVRAAGHADRPPVPSAMGHSCQTVSEGRICRARCVIFVSLGTHQQGFSRALNVVADLDVSEEILAQIGETSPPEAAKMRWVKYMTYEEVRDNMRKASCVISHAGVGTILTALDIGHVPIVIPRLHAYGEHVDNHQLELASQLSDRGLILCYVAGGSVAPLVEIAQSSRGASRRGGKELGAEIAREVAIARQLPSRRTGRRSGGLTAALRRR
jgi:UDP-N-acetylglucosamine transferase subunit ALG13